VKNEVRVKVDERGITRSERSP